MKNRERQRENRRQMSHNHNLIDKYYGGDDDGC